MPSDFGVFKNKPLNVCCFVGGFRVYLSERAIEVKGIGFHPFLETKRRIHLLSAQEQPGAWSRDTLAVPKIPSVRWHRNGGYCTVKSCMAFIHVLVTTKELGMISAHLLWLTSPNLALNKIDVVYLDYVFTVTYNALGFPNWMSTLFFINLCVRNILLLIIQSGEFWTQSTPALHGSYKMLTMTMLFKLYTL